MTWRDIQLKLAMIGIKPEDEIEELRLDFRPDSKGAQVRKEREEDIERWVITNESG